MKYVSITNNQQTIWKIIVGTRREIDESKNLTGIHTLELIKDSGIYILTHLNWEDIAKMCDLVSYDFAVPQDWMREQVKREGDEGYFQKHYVWCYDRNHIGGEPVSLAVMLETVLFPKIFNALLHRMDNPTTTYEVLMHVGSMPLMADIFYALTKGDPRDDQSKK